MSLVQDGQARGVSAQSLKSGQTVLVPKPPGQDGFVAAEVATKELLQGNRVRLTFVDGGEWVGDTAERIEVLDEPVGGIQPVVVTEGAMNYKRETVIG